MSISVPGTTSLGDSLLAKPSKVKKIEGLKSALSLDPAWFKSAGDKSSAGKTFFLIGFDTEYEKSDGTVGEDTKSNRVLSYQFCGMLVDELGDTTDKQWSGILYPQGPRVEDRLSIPEFLQAVLREGVKKHAGLTFPTEVYLIAHFTRADVPGFREFKDKELREKLLLQNIRNLFMNLEKPFLVDFQSPGQEKPIELKVAFRDTMTLAPTGLRSLDDLGKLLGLDKLKLSDDPEKEYFYKTHMGQLLQDDRELFERYAIRDAEICATYAARMIRAATENLGDFQLPKTLSSKGLHLLKKFWADNKVDPLTMVGKEQVEELVWSRSTQRLKKLKRAVYLPFLSWNEQFLTEAYHGGRNEQFWFGPAPEAVWYDYDLASAYPSAMTLIGTPDWSTCETISDIDELLGDRFSATDLVFANVDFEFPEDVHYPVLPVRTNYGLIFPRKGNSTTHISEIKLAHRLGCKIDLVEAKYIRTTGGGNPAAQTSVIRPFADFAKYCVDKRNTYPKGSLQNLMWKEIVNSTYGKTGQGLRERRVYDLREADTKQLPPSEITNPAFAAFITAFCRGVLGEIMNSLPDDVSIFSVTTDGFLTTASPKQMQTATKGELSGYYRRARNYLSGQNDIYEVKHIIRRPVGWRTRGQATLLASSPEDWSGSGAKPSDNGSYVLAKGGIKLNSRLSKAEQNREILATFAGRKPGDILAYTIGLGIRDMYAQGSDFVDKNVEKRLSMEFDWKRRPSQPVDANVSGTLFPAPSHLSFQTTPWNDVAQFNLVREMWSQYQSSSPRCLKTATDLKYFVAYFESTTSLQGEYAKYLKREDGAMKRLRQQIAIAQKFRAAGTHVYKDVDGVDFSIRSASKITASAFASFLCHNIGMTCKQEDVENARKKKVFSPGQVPNTPEVKAALEKIKADLFPELRIDELLTKSVAVTLVE